MKGDSVVAYLRYGPPLTQMLATRKGRTVRSRYAGKYVYLEEVTQTGRVVRTSKIAADAVIVVEEDSRAKK